MSSVLSFFVGLVCGSILGVIVIALFVDSSRLSRYEEEQERCEK